MKFWQKIFIYSLILFVIVFNLGAVFLIENSHNLSLQREVDRGLSEHLSVFTGVNVSLSIVKDRMKYSRDLMNGILYITINDYLERFKDGNIYIEVLDSNNNIIISNLDFKVLKERKELENPLLGKRRYIIRDIGDKTFLFITNLLELDGEFLKFSYIRDITYIYEDRKKQYDFFVELDIIVTVILAMGIYFLSKFITIPINKLINSTKIIAKGNFSERAKINSNDEIGLLSRNFNEMAMVIEDKIRRLEKNSQEKQRFIDNLTHELKTPLTSIIGYADLLRSTKYNEERFSKGLNYIYSEGKRLEKMSFKLMDLILLKKENFKMKNNELKSLLLEIKDSLKLKLENKNIELIISGEEYKVLLERDLIKILIMNLVDNAIKASKEDSKIFINIYESKDSRVVLEVKDEGIGITKEDLKNVMEPFYMVDKARSRANNGIGLGLAICKQIANVHKAEFKIESEPNNGTVVKIIFN